MKLELKSVLIGVLLTVNVLMLLGLNSNDEESQIGRYQVITAEYIGGKNFFIMDTTDGKFVKIMKHKETINEANNNPNRLR